MTRVPRPRHRVDTVLQRIAGCAHQPDRPEWICAACPTGTPWPCSPARVRLAEAYGPRRDQLAADLAAMLTIAAAETPATPPAELHTRFVAWAL